MFYVTRRYFYHPVHTGIFPTLNYGLLVAAGQPALSS